MPYGLGMIGVGVVLMRSLVFGGVFGLVGGIVGKKVYDKIKW